MNKYFLINLLIAICFITLTCCKSKNKNHIGETSKNQLPNIVFLLVDDLGLSSLPIYHKSPGDRGLTTQDPKNTDSIVKYSIPNLDAFSKQARVYTNMYATSLCAPSRGSLITGRYPFRNGIVDPQWSKETSARFIPNTYNSNDVIIKEDGYLNTKQIGYPEVLKIKGYNTIFGGKWNLRYGQLMSQLDGNCLSGKARTSDSLNYITYNIPNQVKHLNDMGFTQPLDSIALVGNTIDYYPPQLENGKDLNEQYMPYYLFNWMKSKTIQGYNSKKPQYVHYCFGFIHDPYQSCTKKKYGYSPPPTDQGDYSPNSVWAKKVEEVDSLIGEFVSTIDSLDNVNGTETIIIIAGDNGTEQPYYSEFDNTWVQGGKFSNRSQGARVEFMVRWPGKVTPGIDSTLLDFTDVFPTLVELVSGEDALDNLVKQNLPGFLPTYNGGKHSNPTAYSYTIDGQSFLNKMTNGALGKNNIPPREAVFSQTNAQAFVANKDYIVCINSDSTVCAQGAIYQPSGFYKIDNSTLVDTQISNTNFIDAIGGGALKNPTGLDKEEYVNYLSLRNYYCKLFPAVK